ncbi:MAG: 4Fe-4S ferredoxin, partial [Armatimonadota bacterium]
RVLFINHVCAVTPFCDCWGFSSPSIVPDVRIFAGEDIVAVEQASIDSVRTEDFIEGSLPAPFEVRDTAGHLFQKIHGKDPYLQCEEAAGIGLGSRSYEIVEVE